MRWLLAMWFLCATLGVPAHGPLSAELSSPTTPAIAAPDSPEPPTAFDEEPTASELSLVGGAALPAPLLVDEACDWPGDHEHSSVVDRVPVPPPIV